MKRTLCNALGSREVVLLTLKPHSRRKVTYYDAHSIYLLLFLMKNMSISFIIDHEHKSITQQSIKTCKIIAICYKVIKS
jgi:hypothetical protein